MINCHNVTDIFLVFLFLKPVAWTIVEEVGRMMPETKHNAYTAVTVRGCSVSTAFIKCILYKTALKNCQLVMISLFFVVCWGEVAAKAKRHHSDCHGWGGSGSILARSGRLGAVYVCLCVRFCLMDWFLAIFNAQLTARVISERLVGRELRNWRNCLVRQTVNEISRGPGPQCASQ